MLAYSILFENISGLERTHQNAMKIDEIIMMVKFRPNTYHLLKHTNIPLSLDKYYSEQYM